MRDDSLTALFKEIDCIYIKIRSVYFVEKYFYSLYT